jgi:uncharacterized RDD family membrane protein YckC
LSNTQTIFITDQKKASFWKRFIAFWIDGFLILLISKIASTIFTLPEVIEDIMGFLLYYGLGIITEYYQQATLGKLFMGLWIVRVDGRKPTFINCFLRNFGKLISALPLFYGFLRILAPHQKQTMHDELGRCLIVEAR